MKKDDIKAFFLIFFILILISGITIFGIKMYTNIMKNEQIEQIFQSNEIMIPKENNDSTASDKNNDALNQIVSVGSQNKQEQSNTKNKVNEYYYKQLDSYAQIIYNELNNNKENLKTGTYIIDFGKKFNELLSKENGWELLQEYYKSAIEAYWYDHPETFYLDRTKMYIKMQTTKKIYSTNYKVQINYGENDNYLAKEYNSRENIIVAENEIKQETQEIIEKAEGKSDYQKILLIHDYLVDNVSYDQTLSKDNIYNILGVIVNKEAVCEGYAKAFKYLMDQVGIESIIVIGKATDSNGNTANHAWNYVKLNEAWYAVDVTWDDPLLIGGVLTKKYKYKYFLKGSTTMNQDHIVSYTFVENGKVYEHPILKEKDY